MRHIAIHTLESLSLIEAEAYLSAAKGDEVQAAYNLALDRNTLAGALEPPDAAEVHHALFMIRRARGMAAPSFDGVRLELRRRVAA